MITFSSFSWVLTNRSGTMKITSICVWHISFLILSKIWSIPKVWRASFYEYWLFVTLTQNLWYFKHIYCVHSTNPKCRCSSMHQLMLCMAYSFSLIWIEKSYFGEILRELLSYMHGIFPRLFRIWSRMSVKRGLKENLCA